MGGTARRLRPGGDPAVNPKLAELLERDELDWDNEKHREAYLRAWVNGEVNPSPIAPAAEGGAC